MINDTAVGSDDSALEAICVHIAGDLELQLIRQLTAAALNCVISGGGEDCSSVSIENVYQACNVGCETDTFPVGYCEDGTSCSVDADCAGIGDETCTVLSMNDCIEQIDCFNNGGVYEGGMCWYYQCAEGTPFEGALCNSDAECFDGVGVFQVGACEPIPGNCHDRELCNEDIGLCFQPPGPAGSSHACKDANQNDCIIPGGEGCDTNDPDECIEPDGI